MIAPHDSQERFESLGVDVFRGAARFVSPQEVDVDGVRLRAVNFVIATGARPTLPPVPGLAERVNGTTAIDSLRSRVVDASSPPTSPADEVSA